MQVLVIFLFRRESVTAMPTQSQPFGFRAFMVKHQYKVMLVSLAVGIIWVGIYHYACYFVVLLSSDPIACDH